MDMLLLDYLTVTLVVALLLSTQMPFKKNPLLNALFAVAMAASSLYALGYRYGFPRWSITAMALAYVGAVVNSIASKAERVEVVRRRMPKL